MVLSIPDMGAKYPAAFTDADGDPMDGAKSYRLRLPANFPARLFFVCLRLYGPVKAFFDQSWKRGDVENVK